MPSVSGKTGYWWSVTTVRERRHVPRVISIWCCCIHITFVMQYLPWVSSQNVLFSARLGFFFFFPTARHLWSCQCPATEKKCQHCQGSSAGKPFMGFLHSLSYSYLESASPNNVALWYHIHEPPTWYCTHEPGTAPACSCLLCYHKMFKNLVTNVLICVCARACICVCSCSCKSTFVPQDDTEVREQPQLYVPAFHHVWDSLCLLSGIHI